MKPDKPNMPTSDLLARKKELSKKYLGLHGIHGIGVRRKEGFIYVMTSHPLEAPIQEKMTAEAQPHPLSFIQAPRFKLL
jgi:hypothetical protein